MAILFALTVLAVHARADLTAGAAKVDITPALGPGISIPLGGYGARRGAPATEVHDPVTARALVLKNQGKCVALVSVDLCFFPRKVCTAIITRVHAEIPELDASNILLAATHTHSGPDPLAMDPDSTESAPGWPRYNSALLEFTVGHAAEAIETAYRAMHPARLGWSVVDGKGLNRNRRGGPHTDTAMTVIKVEDANHGRIAEVVSYASHPTLYGADMRQISADWPGVMEARIEHAVKGGVCLFLNGAEGDAAPQIAASGSEAERVEAYGSAVAERALQAENSISTSVSVEISAWSAPVTLPPRRPNGLYLVAAAGLGIPIDRARLLVTRLMPERSQLSCVRIGKLLMLGFPCEPTADLGLEARKIGIAAGYRHVDVVALVNDWLAYALTPGQYHEGGYEVGMSFYGDQLGPRLLDAVATAVKH